MRSTILVCVTLYRISWIKIMLLYSTSVSGYNRKKLGAYADNASKNFRSIGPTKTRNQRYLNEVNDVDNWTWSRVRDSLLPHSNILGQDMNSVDAPQCCLVKRLATCSTRGGSQEMYITFSSAMWIRQNPLWLWNPEETSLDIQNRGTSGLKIGHVNVSDKKTKKKKDKKKDNWKWIGKQILSNLVTWEIF